MFYNADVVCPSVQQYWDLRPWAVHQIVVAMLLDVPLLCFCPCMLFCRSTHSSSLLLLCRSARFRAAALLDAFELIFLSIVGFLQFITVLGRQSLHQLTIARLGSFVLIC
jgi:hypothetical protein